MNLVDRYFPWAVPVLAAVVLMGMMMPHADPDGAMHVLEAGRLPVMEGGRIKPLDSFARTTLLQISNKQSFRDEKGAEQPAIRWLFEVAGATGRKRGGFDSEKKPAFRVDSEPLREMLSLSKKPDYLYSVEDLRPGIDRLLKEASRAAKTPPEQHTELDRKTLELGRQLLVFAEYAPYETPYQVFRIENDQVLGLLLLEPRSGWYRYAFGEITPRLSLLLQEANRASRLEDSKRTVFDVKVLELARNVERYVKLANLDSDTLLSVAPGPEETKWRRLEEVSDKNPPIRRLVESYGARETVEFNKTVGAYRAELKERMPAVVTKASFEAFYNHASPFFHAIWLYVLIFLMAVISWLGWSEPLRRGALGLLILTVLLHTAALFARMYLTGRPGVFITNLYGTAVFIGWIGALSAIGLELVYRNGVGLACGALLGFLTCIVAHNLAGGDTLEQVVAVLDTNFWLATHVTIVNMGYAATLLAGLLGAGLILVGVFTPVLSRDLYRTLGQMTYGIVCFALLFSFVGTVLGGIWADQSWGRFWGWDPKENGALLIVLMNALILHARWGGMIQQRGLAVLAVLGNIITVWSWFGVNMLGVGLHSYGFIPEAVFWILVVVGGHLVVAAAGLVPLAAWRSAGAILGRGA